MTTAPYRCPTSCDEDCEINGWGCHECHDIPAHREHDPEACEARMLAGNLRSLLDGGHAVELVRHPEVPERLEPVRIQVRKGAAWTVRFGAGAGDALAKAVEWSRREVAGMGQAER